MKRFCRIISIAVLIFAISCMCDYQTAFAQDIGSDTIEEDTSVDNPSVTAANDASIIDEEVAESNDAQSSDETLQLTAASSSYYLRLGSTTGGSISGTYRVNSYDNRPKNVNSSGTTSIPSGYSVVLVAHPADGYRFVEWAVAKLDSNMNVTGPSNSLYTTTTRCAFTMTKDLALCAVFEKMPPISSIELWVDYPKVGETVSYNYPRNNAACDMSADVSITEGYMINDNGYVMYSGSLGIKPNRTYRMLIVLESYEYTFSNSTSSINISDAEVYRVTASNKEEPSDSGTSKQYVYLSFKTGKANIENARIGSIDNQAYTGSQLMPYPMITFGDLQLEEGTDYRLSYDDNISVGTATITISGMGGYTGVLERTFDIQPADLSRAAISSISDQSFTGKRITPEPVVKLGSITLKKNTDYTLTYKNNTDVGTGTVVVTGKGNYTGTTDASFKIAAAPISKATISSIENQIFTGKAIAPKPTVKLGSTTLVWKTDYTLSYKNNTKVGTATITITGKGNYAGTKSTTFKIVGGTLKPTWTGAARMPVSATADYKVTNGGYIRVKSNGKWATSDSIVSLSSPSTTTKRVTAKKTGSTTLYLLSKDGKQVASKKITVYALDGKYEIQSAVDSSYVLDIRGKSKANSARMIVWPRNGGANQRYQFIRQSDGTYGIKCVHSGKYVDVQGGGTKKSQPVIQYTWNGGTNQRWAISVDASNCVTFTCKKSGMCFDIQGGKVTLRAQMIQYPANNGKNQKWVLNKK